MIRHAEIKSESYFIQIQQGTQLLHLELFFLSQSQLYNSRLKTISFCPSAESELQIFGGLGLNSKKISNSLA